MSVKMSNLVWDACLKPEKKYILLALADQANDEGYCVYRKGEEITRSMLAEKTGLSERTIQRQIADMLEDGIIEITRAASHHTPPEYRIRGDKLSSLNRETMGEILTHLQFGQGRQNDSPDACGKPTSGETSTTGRGDIHDREGRHSRQGGETQCLPIYKVLDVRDVKDTSLSHVLSTAEREMVTKELQRLFPQITSLPDAIPIERAYLFLHKVRTGEIRKDQLYSPIAYMAKMHDEDITALLRKDRERRAKVRAG